MSLSVAGEASSWSLKACFEAPNRHLETAPRGFGSFFFCGVVARAMNLRWLMSHAWKMPGLDITIVSHEDHEDDGNSMQNHAKPAGNRPFEAPNGSEISRPWVSDAMSVGLLLTARSRPCGAHAKREPLGMDVRQRNILAAAFHATWNLGFRPFLGGFGLVGAGNGGKTGASGPYGARLAPHLDVQEDQAAPEGLGS